MLPSGTVTFLFTDIEGSTGRWEREPERMKVALEEHNRILERAIAEFSGSVFKTVGDAFCIAFQTAEHAAGAAIAAQADLAKAPEGLRVRMGLHTGSSQPCGSDYFGPPVNRVARIMAAANGGQILMSDATKGLLPPTFSAVDLGRHALRDLLEPIHLWQLGVGDFSQVRALSSVRNNLPLQTTSFIGREKEIAEVAALLERSRIVTLTGTGGTGKSRLALQLAATLMDRFPDGVWLCELAALPDREDVLRAIVSAVSPSETGGSLRDRLVAYLSGKKCLLIIDNCEHVLDPASKVAEELIQSCVTTTILTTSREPLGVKGEASYRVPSLPSPEPDRKPNLEDLERYGSTALFVDRLSTVAPNYELQPTEAVTIAKICTRLDGIPLAIELAAARGRAMSLEHIEKRLDDRFRLLTGGSRNALSRQQTLRALIDWSVQLLDPSEKRFFVSLAVFSGGWDLEAAENVCAGEELELETWAVLDLLTALVDKSLVLFDHASDRYQMLESVRQYALERLEQEPLALLLRDRHSAFYLSCFASSPAELASPDIYKRFSTDYENFRSAVEWSAGRDDGVEGAIKGMTSNWDSFLALGRPDEFCRLLEPLMEALDPQSPYEPNAQLTLTMALIFAGNPRGLERAKAAQSHHWDVMAPGLRRAWTSALIYSLFKAEQFEESLRLAQAEIAVTTPESNPGYGYLHVNVANNCTLLGRFAEAEAAHAVALSDHLMRGDERGYIGNLSNVCGFYVITGRMDMALSSALELIQRSTGKGIQLSARAFALLVFGHKSLDLGDLEGGALFLAASDRIRAASGSSDDPMDKLAANALRNRVEKEVPAEVVVLATDKARRVDLEPWFAAIAPLTTAEILAMKSVAFRELLTA